MNASFLGSFPVAKTQVSSSRARASSPATSAFHAEIDRAATASSGCSWATASKAARSVPCITWYRSFSPLGEKNPGLAARDAALVTGSVGVGECRPAAGSAAGPGGRDVGEPRPREGGGALDPAVGPLGDPVALDPDGVADPRLRQVQPDARHQPDRLPHPEPHGTDPLVAPTPMLRTAPARCRRRRSVLRQVSAASGQCCVRSVLLQGTRWLGRARGSCRSRRGSG